MTWYLWQILTAVKYIQILRQHTTHKKKKHQVLFATTRKLNIKHTHFLKEAFVLLFFLILPSRICEGNSYLHLMFVSVTLFCYMVFFFFLYKTLSFKTGITGFGEWYRYVVFLLNRWNFTSVSLSFCLLISITKLSQI